MQEAILGTPGSKFGVSRGVYVVRLSDGAHRSCRVFRDRLGLCVICQPVRGVRVPARLHLARENKPLAWANIGSA